MKPTNQGNSLDPVLTARAEAAAWVTRLHGKNRSAEMERGFHRWLAERPENAAEFEGMTEVWDLVLTGAPGRAPRLERWERTAEAEELLALRRKLRRMPARIKLSIAASTMVFICAAVLWSHWSSPTYATSVGEQRVVQLEDGSMVSLNSNSSVIVDYEKGARRLRLKRGEALFQVTKDAKRPFTVTAGNNRVTALGTSFLVRVDGERTAVTLVEGKVTVDLSSRGDAPPSRETSPAPTNEQIVLSPGQRLTLAAMKPPRLDVPQLDAVTAWRRGEVVLEDTPLEEAVAEMNRYDKKRIVIASPDIERLSVSGLYHTGDSQGFAHAVARMYRLRLTEEDGQLRLER